MGGAYRPPFDIPGVGRRGPFVEEGAGGVVAFESAIARRFWPTVLLIHDVVLQPVPLTLPLLLLRAPELSEYLAESVVWGAASVVLWIEMKT